METSTLQPFGNSGQYYSTGFAVSKMLAESSFFRAVVAQGYLLDRRQILIEITQAGQELLIIDAYRQDEWLMRVMAAKATKAEREMLGIAADLLDKLASEPLESSQTSKSVETV